MHKQYNVTKLVTKILRNLTGKHVQMILQQMLYFP